MRDRCGKEAGEYSRGGLPRATKSATWRTGRQAPPAGLVETDAGGDGDVAAADLAEHRDANQPVASLPGQAAHPFAFGAEHPCDRFREVDREEIVGPVV